MPLAFARRLFLPLTLSVSLCALLAGCGTGPIDHSVSSAQLGTMKGRVFGGQEPIVGATVQLWQAGTSGYGSSATALGTSVTTAGDGSFTYGTYTCDPTDPQVYITASGGNAQTGAGNNGNILLAASLADCDSAPSAVVNINEVSTVATAFALGQFFGGASSGDSFGSPADSVGFPISNTNLVPTLISVPLGTVNPNVAATPSAMGITIDAAKIYSMANTLAACVNDADAGFPECTSLYVNTAPPGGMTPMNTLEAAVDMSLYPYLNVSALYTLGAMPQAPFPGLSTAPNDWTVSVAYTSESFGLSVPATTAPGMASMDIDVYGNVWFPSDNTTAGTGVGVFAASQASFFGPFGTGYATLPQYVAINTDGDLYMTDSASASFTVLSVGTGSVLYNESFTGALALGPIASDLDQNSYLAYTDTSGNYDLGSIYFPSSSPGTPTDDPAAGTLAYAPSGIVTDQLGDVTVATGGLNASGASEPCALESYSNANSIGDPPLYNEGPGTVEMTGSSPCMSGGVETGTYDALAVASTADQVCSYLLGCNSYGPGEDQPEGIAMDGLGAQWVANAANGSVSTFSSFFGGYSPTSPVEYLHPDTAPAPYAMAIDTSGDIWLANASCAGSGCSPTSFTLTEIVGAAAPTIDPIAAQEGGLGGSEPMVRRRGAAVPVDNRPSAHGPSAQPGVSKWTHLTPRR